MMSINKILERHGIGESFGIKIKKTKGLGESYKTVARCKKLAIAGETKAIKNGINEVVRDQIRARGESTNVKVVPNVEIKSYRELKAQNGLVSKIK